MHGTLGRSVIALHDLLEIGALKISKSARIIRAKERIAKYQSEAEEFHRTIDGADSDIPFLVQSDVAKLRDAVESEISQRAQRKMDDEPTRFLEAVYDLQHPADERSR